PVHPLRRSKFITAPFPFDRIPEATPFVIDTHQGISIRREGAGLLLGIGRRDDTSSFDTQPDWSLRDALIERAVRRAPALADASLMRAWAGLYEMTPDQTGIISAVPAVDGLYVVAGFSGHGFMHGPIAGQLMAELIADGCASTVDIAPLALDRFARAERPRDPLPFTWAAPARAADSATMPAVRHDRSPAASHRHPRSRAGPDRGGPLLRHADGGVRRRGHQDRAARQ